MSNVLQVSCYVIRELKERRKCFGSTLFDAPLQLCKNVDQQHLAERLVELREDVTNGVERMVARSGHPFGLLWRTRAQRKWSVIAACLLPEVLKGFLHITNILIYNESMNQVQTKVKHVQQVFFVVNI